MSGASPSAVITVQDQLAVPTCRVRAVVAGAVRGEGVDLFFRRVDRSVDPLSVGGEARLGDLPLDHALKLVG